MKTLGTLGTLGTLFLIFFVIKIIMNFRGGSIIIKKIGNLNHLKHIWMYWENKIGTTKPHYIQLCYRTILKNTPQDFKVHLLDEKSVYNFLPNLRKDINKLSIPQKADYIRLSLLDKYGGIWFDSDIILFKSPILILEKLKNHDFIGFGCHTSQCKKSGCGYPYPANWIMASRENSYITSLCLQNANKMLEAYKSEYFNKPQNYHNLGRTLLWSNIKILLRRNWSYHHFSSSCLDRDSKNEKIINERYLSREDIDLACVDSMIFAPFYATSPGFPSWFTQLSSNEILNENFLISKLFRKSLKKI
jgi:hypothetical protein